MDAVPHGPDAAIQMPAQIPQHSIHISLTAPEPPVPLLQGGHLHGMNPMHSQVAFSTRQGRDLQVKHGVAECTGTPGSRSWTLGLVLSTLELASWSCTAAKSTEKNISGVQPDQPCKKILAPTSTDQTSAMQHPLKNGQRGTETCGCDDKAQSDAIKLASYVWQLESLASSGDQAFVDGMCHVQKRSHTLHTIMPYMTMILQVGCVSKSKTGKLSHLTLVPKSHHFLHFESIQPCSDVHSFVH